MRVVLGLSLRRARVRILALALGFGAFELVVALSYASVDQNAVRRLVDSLPPALRALAGTAEITTATGYSASGYLHPVALAIQAAAVVSMATAPARDAETGVAELFLSRPLAPARWLAAQGAAALLGLLVVDLGGYVGGLAGALTVDDLAAVDARPLALALAGSLLLFSAFGAAALLAAAGTRAVGRAVGIAAGALVISYAIDYLAQVWSLARPLRWITAFQYFDPARDLRTGSVPVGDWAVLAAATAVLSALALLFVGRRDLTP